VFAGNIQLLVIDYKRENDFICGFSVVTKFRFLPRNAQLRSNEPR
jgi:hypothetical protein